MEKKKTPLNTNDVRNRGTRQNVIRVIRVIRQPSEQPNHDEDVVVSVAALPSPFGEGLG